MQTFLNRVVTRISRELHLNNYPNLKITTAYYDKPPTLPHVQASIILDNEKAETFSLDITHYSYSLQFDIYSNSHNAIQELDNIAEIIDKTMKQIHFKRERNQFINNKSAPNIKRKVLRYWRGTITDNEIQEI